MGTHPIFESDFDCLTESLITKKHKMSDNEHSGNEMEQDEHVDDLAEDEETPQAIVTTDARTADFDECASYGGAGGRNGSVGDCVEGNEAKKIPIIVRRYLPDGSYED